MKNRKITLLMMLALALLMLPGVSVANTASETSEAPEQAQQTTPEDQLAVEWIMGFMTRHAPPGRKTFYKEAQESQEDALVRYRSIAEDIVEVVYNPETPPLFKGKYGRTRTVTVILGIMLHESGFMRNVDYGIGKYARGDKGNSWCLMQMNVGKGRAWSDAGGWNIKEHRPWRYGDQAEDLIEGSSGPEMVSDRKKCITEGLRLIRLSFRACRSRPFGERLNVYASGRCTAGAEGSQLRLRTATKFWERTAEERKAFADEGVSKLIVAKLEKRAEEEALAAKEAEEKVKEVKEKAAEEKAKEDKIKADAKAKEETPQAKWVKRTCEVRT